MEFVIVRDPAFSSQGREAGREGARRNMRGKDEVLCVFYLGPRRKGLWGWDVV